jgi:hypothetical protein
MFSGQLINQGSAAFNANFTAGNGVVNYTSLTAGSGFTFTLNGSGLDNEGSFLLAGGTLAGAGPLVNGNTLSGYGTITGSGGFTNNAFLNISGGNLTLSNTGVNSNVGALNLAVGESLQLANGTTLTNFGSLNLNGALVSGAGTLNNVGGALNAPGVISATFNNTSGVMLLGNATTLTIVKPSTNGGIIQLTSLSANLTGGAIANAGTIQGIGTVSNAVTNSGTIEADGGTLSLGGSLSNSAGGLIRVGSGNKVLVISGLTTNAGIINLTGGTFDNSGHALSNTNQISGWGTFATGGAGLDNNGSITFSGGLTTVNGPVTNENGKTIVVAYNPAIFTGLVTNNGGGTFNIVSTTATFAGGSSGTFGGTFTNNADSAFAEGGSGTLEVDGAPTLGSASSLAVNESSTLRFKATTGTATIGTGVTAMVNNSATLELAGSVSALSSGANRVNITNSSNASAGVLVSGTHQVVGNIDGSGTTQVNAGSDLTANHIIQHALVIGGAAGSPGLVTINASDASGNPLGVPSGFVVASSLTPSGPFGAGEASSASVSSVGEGVDVAAVSLGNSIGGDPSPVPEPTTLLLALLAVLGVVSTKFARHHLR